jgi:mRNA interferase MazF
MKSITTFDLILVPFPFSDLSAVKKRPCLVLERYEVKRLGSFLVVCMVTSQVDGLSFPGDVPIKEWELAGLPKASLVRLGKIVTLEQSMTLRKLGALEPKDRQATRKAWQGLFRGIAG